MSIYVCTYTHTYMHVFLRVVKPGSLWRPARGARAARGLAQEGSDPGSCGGSRIIVSGFVEMSLLASEARAQRRKRGEEVGVWEEGGEMQGRKKDERKKEGTSREGGGRKRERWRERKRGRRREGGNDE